jgi:transcriptional regulator with XRE-family HTH domain
MAPVKKPLHKRQPHFLRQWRNFRKLSQDTAADRVEVDRSTLAKIELGQVPYNQDILERLALAYGCDVTDLLTVDPLKPDPPRLVYDRLRQASPALRDRALAVLDALLKAG